MNSQNWNVAPHGILFFAAVALFIVLVVHMLGFRVVGAVRVGR